MKNSVSQAVSEPLLTKVGFLEIVNEQHPVLNLRHPLEDTWNLAFKRMVDLLVSTFLILFVLTWVLPLLALLVKLSSKGPVFFLQKRNKRGGKSFTCLKFRTMIVNSEADQTPACINDHRITTFGYFLRRSHLDELPQLLNVWWGDMSLIGPRPHMLIDNRKFEGLFEFYRLRHLVKPGITGLAQVEGYVGAVITEDDLRARVEQDIRYINNWSPALDVHILYRTFFRMIGCGTKSL